MTRTPRSGHSAWLAILGFGVLFVAVCVAAPFFGTKTYSPAMLFSADSEVQREMMLIFWNLRVPRVLCGILVGGTLALGGMVFQAVFRNPLATPFTLGTASGAALGASLAIQCGVVGFSSYFGLSAVTVAAFAGAMLSLLLVFSVVRFSGRFGDAEMLGKCGFGVAVANAAAEVKAVASCVCGDCDDDGVAEWIENNF